MRRPSNDNLHWMGFAISRGACTLRAIAAGMCIAPDLLVQWLQRGERAPHGLYRELWEKYEFAQGRLDLDLSHCILKAAKTDWRAAAWLLQHRGRQVLPLSDDDLAALLGGHASEPTDHADEAAAGV